MRRSNRIRRAVSLVALCAGMAGAAMAEGYKVETLVPGSKFHGVHGLGISPEGALFAGSVIGQELYRVDRTSGAVTSEIAPPQGMADDIAFAPDGTMAWTGFLTGQIFARAPGGEVRQLAEGLPGINSLAYGADGRLFATQVFLADALYEIDPKGEAAPRKIAEGMGGLNGFEVGPDGKIIGPLWFKGQVARVDVESGAIEVVAEGFKVPAAVNLDSKGNIWVVDTALGELVRLDPDGGNRKVVAQLSTSLDNLAIDDKDMIYVSNMADNGVQEINPETGAVRQVVKGALSMPSGLAIMADGEKETLYVADLFAYRSVDVASGEVTDHARMQADHIEYPFNARANGAHVVLSSWFTSTVQVMDRESGHSVKMMHGFAAPYDAVEMPDGSLLVLEVGTGQLTRVTGDEGETREAVATGLVLPVGMVLDGQNAVWITEAGAGTVSRIDLGSGEKTVIAQGLAMPEGMDMAPDGRLIVAEVGKQRVIAITPGEEGIEVLAEGLPVGMPAAAGMPPAYVPTGIAVGRDGAVYVSSDLDNSILKLSPQ
ncbi:Vgb family protein [Rhodalgimonas zhirmunskyi]|uniref:SMP-30/gluconolactonase/LRE family protein n=1 Tax=Rhodalgimonas zhirmunskyi TaxID=2964767 RepID=A0AAJ1U837_9RHOB|nr:SMP-30/gluconolactonase/LRE family protein [Rhodoalgimonas zhirmunskyi]MDQ2095335.1 SMP-30/gluconolactonase/LRE family protein [Rhodoalgimonas zhirmunskyi]